MNLIKSYFFSLLFLIVSNDGYAQKTYTISGIVKEAASGETLIGVNIFIGTRAIGTVTNEYGFYSLTLPSDSCNIVYSFIGFQAVQHRFRLDKDTTINIELADISTLTEVEVNASSNLEKINSTQMGLEEVSIKEAKEIAAMFGEVDILKVLQLKPGVQSGTEGSSGIFVRGGSADQNHFILDEAPVYNPNHMLGLFSTFNADAIKNVKLYKAGFPAQFGGKLSSVVDVRMREGNRKQFGVSGGLGFISSRLTIEGPLVKDKGSFIVAGRRTYVDLFTSILNKANENNPDWFYIPEYSFFDVNTKLNYDLSPKDRLFLSGYFGGDAFSFKSRNVLFDLDWRNIAGTFRWNRTISPKLFANTSFTISDYAYNIDLSFGELELTLGSGIRDLNLKTDFMWMPSPKHELKFGLNAIYHQFSIGQFAGSDNTDVNYEAGSIFHGAEAAVYASHDWTISPKLKLLTGVRLSYFHNDQVSYIGPEPRLALKYNVHNNVAIKASYARMNQYIHLVSTSGATLPTDVWYPSNRRVAPQASDLVAAGISAAIGRDFYINVEGYYKWLHNQITLKDGAQLFLNDKLDEDFLFGKGSSYGGEIYIEKKNGNIRGWIGYTLSWTWHQFAEVNGGQPYHPKNDRRHDISAVIMWDIPWTRPKFPLTFSASWVYGTGNAITLPTKRYIQMDITSTNPFHFIPIYTKRGGFRLPAYHRLDLSLVWKLYPLSKKRFKNDLTFSLYNVYDQRNPFFMYIDAVYEGDPAKGTQSTNFPDKLEARIVSLFPIIPSITWNFKW